MLGLFALLCTASDAFKVWNGFRHEWQRRLAGFATPHRMGSIRNRLYNEEKAQFTFTPGVNGDYAFPALYYTDVENDASVVDFENIDVNIVFDDLLNKTGEYTDHFEANSTVSKEVQFDASGMSFEPILDGFDV